MSTTAAVWLAHGASGGPETMRPYIRQLRKLDIW